MQRIQLANAVAMGQVGAAADSDEALYLLSMLITGVMSQAMANEPDVAWGEGRFTPCSPNSWHCSPRSIPICRLIGTSGIRSFVAGASGRTRVCGMAGRNFDGRD